MAAGSPSTGSSSWGSPIPRNVLSGMRSTKLCCVFQKKLFPRATRERRLLISSPPLRCPLEPLQPATDVSSPPPFEEVDIDKFLAVAPRYGVGILFPEP